MPNLSLYAHIWCNIRNLQKKKKKKEKKTFMAIISITCISIHSLGKVMVIKL